MGALGGIVLFTIVEGIAFAGGIYLWFGVNPYVGTAWWLGWTLLEHIQAYQVGRGKSPFDFNLG